MLERALADGGNFGHGIARAPHRRSCFGFVNSFAALWFHALKLAWKDSVRAEFSSASAESPLPPSAEPAVAFTAEVFSPEAVRAELSARIRELVEASPGLTVKARLRAAARALGLPPGRVTRFFYREVRRVEAHEADWIRYRAAAAKRRRLAALEDEYAALVAELVAEAPLGLAHLVPPRLGAPTAGAAAGAPPAQQKEGER